MNRKSDDSAWAGMCETEAAVQAASSQPVLGLCFLRTDALTFWSAQFIWRLCGATAASRQGAAPSVSVYVVSLFKIFYFFPKVSEPEHCCVCVHSVLTLNSSLRVTSAPEWFPLLPQMKVREEEADRHLTVHSFTCRERKKTGQSQNDGYEGPSKAQPLKTGDRSCRKKEARTVLCLGFGPRFMYFPGQLEPSQTALLTLTPAWHPVTPPHRLGNEVAISHDGCSTQ